MRERSLLFMKFSLRWVFRSWGRVGTTIGGSKLEVKSSLELTSCESVCTHLLIYFGNQEFESKHDAQRDFEFQYEDKTGNKWKNRDNFQKVVFSLYYVRQSRISHLLNRWHGSFSPWTSTWEVRVTSCKNFRLKTANPNCPRPFR